MTFVVHAYIVILCIPEHVVVTYFNKDFSLKEHEAVFWKRQNLIFSIMAGSIGFSFFQTKYFYKQDLKFVVTFGDRGSGDLGLRDLNLEIP